MFGRRDWLLCFVGRGFYVRLTGSEAGEYGRKWSKGADFPGMRRNDGVWGVRRDSGVGGIRGRFRGSGTVLRR